MRGVTTIDTAMTRPRGADHDTVTGVQIVLATTQVGTYTAGDGSPEVRADHEAALARLAKEMSVTFGKVFTNRITRGFSTRIDLTIK